MERRILALGRALRESGAPVSTPEILDAGQAALAVGVGRRADFRAALRASLVKRAEDLASFNEHFDRLFPAGIPRPAGRGGDRARRADADAGEGGDGRSGAATLPGDQRPATSPAASQGEGGSATGPPSDLPAHAGHGPGEAEPSREEPTPEPSESAGATDDDSSQPQPASPDDSRPDPRAASARVAARNRLLAKGFRERWRPEEEREAAAAMEELARRLATRPALRRRRAKRGVPDMTGTLRANLVHGGVPFVLRRRARIEGRRDLLLLADVSGSVRRAAALFLLILARLRDRFSGVRAFAYVDRAAEVPASLARRPAAEIAAALAATLPLDALSDHGEALRRFNRDFPGAAGGRTLVVVLGDARNNRFPAQEWELEAIRRRCRRLVWIVPEPTSLWGSGDSAIAAYAPFCDRVLAAPTPLALAAAAVHLARGGAFPARR